MPKKLTYDEFKKRVESEKNYFLLSKEYKNRETDVTIKHILDDGTEHEYTTKAKNWLHGSRCPICNKKRLSNVSNNPNYKSPDAVYKQIEDMYPNGEYKLISSYVNNKKKGTFIHNLNDGSSHTFEMRVGDFLNNNLRCPKCSGLYSYSPDEFRLIIAELLKGTKDEGMYEVKGDYINNRTKIEFYHKGCNRTFLMRPDDFKNTGQRCPFCSSSKGEEDIEFYLRLNKITYIRGYSFDDCKDKRKLPFDFAIFNENNQIEMLIEFDGRQHFEPIYGKESFEKCILHDKIKNEYCKKNKITLLRIHYKDHEKLNEILDKAVKKS